MEKRINVAELLKDCPSGMELDCTICDNVYFDEVTPHLIKCFVKSDDGRNTIYFHHDGAYMNIPNAKCVIFPKDKTTWKGFHRPFKDGDIIFTHADCTKIGLGHTWISIFEENHDGGVVTYVDYCNEDKDFYTYLDSGGLLCKKKDIIQQRLATEEEKQRLFDVIKARGYKWNPETKTLKKLVKPRFKVGDEIVQRNSISNSWIVNSVNSEYYGLRLDHGFDGIGVLPVSEQDDWELITNKLEKSVEPKFKVGDVIQNEDAYKVTIVEVNVEDKFYGYESTIAKGIGGIAFSEQDDWKLVSNKFDITTLKPFESKVLVRTNNGKWVAAFYSHYDKDVVSLHYCVVGGLWYEQCIPYKGNEYLLNTKDDCSEYYKTWK